MKGFTLPDRNSQIGLNDVCEAFLLPPIAIGVWICPTVKTVQFCNRCNPLDLPVAVLTPDANSEMAEETLQSRAQSVINKPSRAVVVLSANQVIMAGEIYVPGLLRQGKISAPTPRRLQPLYSTQAH